MSRWISVDRPNLERGETLGGVVVFTGDTGPTEAVTELARNADGL